MTMAEAAELASNALNDIFLEGIDSRYKLKVVESSIPNAGRGLFVQEEVPAGQELLRAVAPIVAAV